MQYVFQDGGLRSRNCFFLVPGNSVLISESEESGKGENAGEASAKTDSFFPPRRGGSHCLHHRGGGTR